MKLDTYLLLIVLKDIAKQVKKGNAGHGEIRYHRINNSGMYEVSGTWIERSGLIRIIHQEPNE